MCQSCTTLHDDEALPIIILWWKAMEAHTAMMVGGAVGGAIGGAVGVVGSLATSLAPHLFQRYRDRKAARAITRAYLSGILHMEKSMIMPIGTQGSSPSSNWTKIKR
jgi:hypothetical protein